MGVPGSANALLLASTAAGGYTISRSLRFNSSDSAYLSRTPSSSGNRKKWTWAGWVKRSALGTDQALFSAPQGGGYPNTGIVFNSSNQLRFFAADAGSSVFAERITSAVYRDTSAWMHIVVSVDYANAQAKIYVNGSEVTAFATSTGPSNTDGLINSSGTVHVIGQFSNTWYFNGYLADIWFLDGLTPTTAVVNGVTRLTQLGEFDTNGIWQPKAWDGAALTGNSFHLDFADNSAATATALGKDTSGNSNNWTPNNLSVTAGAGNDSLRDSPSNGTASTGGDAGGVTVGNYCTLNPLDSGGGTISNGNLEHTYSSSNTRIRTTVSIPASGKWYAEFVASNTGGGNSLVGVSTGTNALTGTNWYLGSDADSWGCQIGSGTMYTYHAGAYSSFGTAASGDVIAVAVDRAAGKIWWAVNNTWIGSGDPANGSNARFTDIPSTGELFFAISNQSNSSIVCNFGQRPFAYTAPSGFKALCTANLPTPTIAKGSDYMDVKLYTGNGSTQSISGLNFSPDWVWIKGRSGATDHALYDIVRGVQKDLVSNSTAAETTQTTGLTAFNSGGFDLGSLAKLNTSSATYAAWCWDAGANSSKTYTVTVVSGAFYIDGKQQPTLNLEEGSTYTFDLSAASNSGHPFRLSETVDGPTQYTTGVTTSGTAGNAGATLTIAVASGAPTLYYFCTNHSGMGGQINTNSTAGASNFAGSITSVVRANASAGFSIVTYTGNGTSGATVGHGLGVTPEFIVVKRRDTAGTGWISYHKSLTSNQYYMYLNTTGAQASGGVTTWNLSSTTVGLHSYTDYNANGSTYVMYAWAPVVGYSAMSSFIGNGGSTFVYLGFRPRWLLIKNAGQANDWFLMDSARSTYNEVNTYLFPNSSAAEATYGWIDFLSNGFKVNNTGTGNNNNGITMIYAAFAESPFALARAR